MMKVLEIAIEKLKALPEDKQVYAAEVIEQITAAALEACRGGGSHRRNVRDP